MRARLGRLPAVHIALLATLVVGCNDGNSGENTVTPPPPTPAIAVSINNSSIAIAQGASGSVIVSISRSGGFAGAVNLVVEGIPTGVGITLDPSSIPGGSTTSALAITVAPTVAPGTSTLTVRASGSGVSDATTALALTISPAGGFSLSVLPSPVVVVAGSTASATLSITRNGAFTGDVTVSVTGAPAGLSVTPASTVVSGSSTTIVVTAASTIAAGTYPLVVHGTAAGIAEQTASLSVQVNTLPQGTVTLQFCGATVPIWIAGQSDGGAWTRLSGANGVFTMPIGTRGAIALVEATDNGTFDTRIVYGTAAELTALGNSLAAVCTKPFDGFRNLNGSLAGIGAGQTGLVAMGSVGTSRNFDGPFGLYGVPDVPSDLAAMRVTETLQGYTTDRMVIRRDVGEPSGSTLPVLDFLSAEAFTPASAMATIVGLNADAVLLDATLYAGGNTVAPLSDYTGGSPAPFTGVAAPQLRANDLHELFVVAAGGGASDAGRGAFAYFRSFADQTITLGPAMSPVVVTGLSSSAPYRFDMQSDWQSAYGNTFSGMFQDDANVVVVYTTPAFAGGTVVTWHVSIPDLSGAGYNPVWGLRSSSILWSGMSSNANSLATIFGSTLSESSSYIFGARLSTGASLATKRTIAAKLLRGIRPR